MMRFIILLFLFTSFAHASQYFWNCGDDVGSRYFWERGDLPGSSYYWKRGDGPGSEYYWNKGDGYGSKYFWDHGTGVGSQYYYQRGTGPGSYYFWMNGRGPGSRYFYEHGGSTSADGVTVALCLTGRFMLPLCEAYKRTVQTQTRNSCISHSLLQFTNFLNSTTPALECHEFIEP